MTAPTAPRNGATVRTPSATGLWRRWRGPVALLGAVALLAAVIALGAVGTEPEGHLDPEAVDQDGSRALAAIADEQGVPVLPVRSVSEAAEAAEADTIIVVAHSFRLTPEELAELSRAPGSRLLVEPTTAALETQAQGVAVGGRAAEPAPQPECALAAAHEAGPAGLDRDVYSVDDPAPWSEVVECYPAADGAGLLVLRAEDGGEVVVLGSDTPLRNGSLDEEGNAALALNLLDGHSSVVWLVPDSVVGAGDSSIWDLLPGGFYTAAAQLVVAALLLALWRGRRLGAVVPERLPVVVRAAETTEGRARLYRARQAAASAADALRAAVVARLRPALGLGASDSARAVAQAAAERTGRDPRWIEYLLYGGQATAEGTRAADAALVELADELDKLEGEVLGGGRDG